MRPKRSVDEGLLHYQLCARLHGRELVVAAGVLGTGTGSSNCAAEKNDPQQTFHMPFMRGSYSQSHRLPHSYISTAKTPGEHCPPCFPKLCPGPLLACEVCILEFPADITGL